MHDSAKDTQKKPVLSENLSYIYIYICIQLFIQCHLTPKVSIVDLLRAARAEMTTECCKRLGSQDARKWISGLGGYHWDPNIRIWKHQHGGFTDGNRCEAPTMKNTPREPYECGRPCFGRVPGAVHGKNQSTKTKPASSIYFIILPYGWPSKNRGVLNPPPPQSSICS